MSVAPAPHVSGPPSGRGLSKPSQQKPRFGAWRSWVELSERFGISEISRGGESRVLECAHLHRCVWTGAGYQFTVC